jgi:hypothetical protein
MVYLLKKRTSWKGFALAAILMEGEKRDKGKTAD